MRRFAMLLPLVLLAACEDSPPAALPTAQATASFPKGGLVDTIQINAVDRLPLRAAALIAPDGSETPARDVEADAHPTSNFAQIGAGAAPGTVFSPQSTLANAVVPANPTYSGRPREEVTLLTTVSSAAIPLPDPVAYRRDWQHYRIRLDFGTPGSTAESREIAAPEPPPQ